MRSSSGMVVARSQACTSGKRMVGVIFDLGGVVLNSPFDAIAQYARRQKLDRSAINRIILSSGENGAFAQLERGELTVDEFALPFQQDCVSAGFEHDALDGSHLISQIIEACTPRPLMLHTLQLLQDEPAIRTAALTNNFIAQHGAFVDAANQIRPLFDVFVESAVEHIRKPDPAIYELTCKRLEIEPEHCIFLDDIGQNLKPARAMGMRTIKCAFDDTSGADAIGALARLLGGNVEQALLHSLPRARL